MQGHDIIVIGASAGGIEVLRQLIPVLPGDLPAAIFVVLHVPSHGNSVLPRILSRGSKLKASHAIDEEVIQPGHIYVAPPDYHMIVKHGHISLSRGPRENNHRPAIDVLFRTAARAYGSRVIGIVLSGTLDDGTAGLVTIKGQGGIAIVQNPEDAMFDGMPRSAIENVEVDYILPISEMASVLTELVDTPVEEKNVEPMSRDMAMEADMAELELEAMQNPDRPGKPSPYGCPSCGGVLWEIDEGKLVRYRCRTGHAYSTNSLLASQSDQLEEALWNALRALEEKAALAVRMEQRARRQNQPFSANRFQEQGQQAQQRATILREVLLTENNKDLSTNNGHLTATLPPNGNSSKSVPELTEKLDNHCDVQAIALCASAGGLPALSEILSALPADFPAAITIVQHIAPQYPSHLADILSKHTALQVKQAEEGDRLQPGRVYIAPPDRHLLVNPDRTISLAYSQLVHFLRPSADLLLESMAASLQEKAIAVILTGMGNDGSMGVQAVKEMGGIVIAQDEVSSAFFGMPQAAMNTGTVNRITPLKEIAAMLMNLVIVKDEYEQFGDEPGI